MWFALLAGLIEVLIIAFRQRVLGDLVFRNAHFIWMAPVGLVCVFAAATLCWWLIVRRRLTRVGLIRLLVFLAALSVISVIVSLHDLAVILLAAGLTPHLARTLVARERGFATLVRRSLPLLAGVVIVLVLLAVGAPIAREALALRGLPAAPTGAPNVLLIILDTVRGGSLSLLGHDRRTTPQLEELGSRGVVFERAIAPSPWTLPSHASVFTGRQPNELSANFNVPLDGTFPTLAEVLGRYGYATAGFVANQFNVDYEHGLSRGFLHWEDYPVTLGQVAYNTALLRRFLLDGPQGRQNSRLLQALGMQLRIGEKDARRINEDALRWLADQGDRPTFAFLNYFDAHFPYVPRTYPWRENSDAIAPRWSTRARLRRAFSRGPKRGVSAEDEQELLDTYESEIAWLDARVGELLDSLDARGALDNTIVIVTSDHGEEFGEHGRFEHGNDVYLTQLHVPLVISFPRRVPSGQRIARPVGLRNLPATILDLIGVQESAPLPGRSLATLWSNDSSGLLPQPFSVLQRSEALHASLVTPTLHYVFENGRESLFRYRDDPGERRSLRQEGWAADSLRHFRRELARRLASDAPQSLLQLINREQGARRVR